jgi:hypothetical protein
MNEYREEAAAKCRQYAMEFSRDLIPCDPSASALSKIAMMLHRGNAN